MSRQRGAKSSRPASARPPRTRRRRAAAAQRGAGAGKRLSGRRLALGVVAILTVLMFIPSISTGIRQAQRIHALEQGNSATRAEVSELTAKQDQLKNPEYLQRMAREQQGYVKKGEKAYIVIDDKPSAQEQPADEQYNKASAARPWYIEFSDSLRSLGLATETKQ